MSTKKRGRPELPKMMRKTMLLCARFDQRTYRACREAAETAGMTLTAWVRDRLVAAANRDLAA